MRDDLGMPTGEVHAKAREVLHFWFEELTSKQHFEKDADVDAQIAWRFACLRTALLSGGAINWRDDRQALLAAVIVLDQFSRNIYRGQAASFAADALALALARRAIARGWDRELPPDRRHFLYMPLMHSEDIADQQESVRRFEALDNPDAAQFARDHRDVIARFGRFPTRNAALGRESSEAERAYLSRPDAGW
ncbi:DUF924 domain-containing protein [Stakelama sp. CBK3Z-3]|uniref:DUF924 domain-containing protein n=1 Tax=Stakelama flava TaxID=2860338 RepID=A0ABS6XI14_9SPHN|nr:DUF924 family protein [Stakelama flava]MBW4329473.1 DUF924 domain-containing protein [Stakelama flava]